MADRVARLSPQLYVQLQCQIVLIEQIIRYATLSYVQRHLRTLGDFRWRIDQKDDSRTAYEIAFSGLVPMLLQTRGLSCPLLTLEGADYREFSRYGALAKLSFSRSVNRDGGRPSSTMASFYTTDSGSDVPDTSTNRPVLTYTVDNGTTWPIHKGTKVGQQPFV